VQLILSSDFPNSAAKITDFTCAIKLDYQLTGYVIDEKQYEAYELGRQYRPPQWAGCRGGDLRRSGGDEKPAGRCRAWDCCNLFNKKAIIS
ncbi:hypothetical protein M513_00118, partial [Trichuris suis]